MEKTIKIGKKEVRLNNNVGWTMEYRDQFGKDILPTIMPMIASMIESVAVMVGDKTELRIEEILASLEGKTMDVLLPLFQTEFVDIAINIVWAMAKSADETIEPPKQWVKQFDVFPLDVIMPTVLELVMKGFVSSKNLTRLKTIKKTLQPSLSMNSSLQDSNED